MDANTVAQRLRVTAGHVGRLCREGKIKAWKVAGEWRIERREYDCFLVRRRAAQKRRRA